ncbi:hypothetical protein ASE72_09205 [Sphingomonas sp. Leaf20]|nr:hypothetical protein ASE72_09205 [Sphingomonas sp. Leaf20]
MMARVRAKIKLSDYVLKLSITSENFSTIFHVQLHPFESSGSNCLFENLTEALFVCLIRPIFPINLVNLFKAFVGHVDTPLRNL